jgi:hypothetical protein
MRGVFRQMPLEVWTNPDISVMYSPAATEIAEKIRTGEVQDKETLAALLGDKQAQKEGAFVPGMIWATLDYIRWDLPCDRLETDLDMILRDRHPEHHLLRLAKAVMGKYARRNGSY